MKSPQDKEISMKSPRFARLFAGALALATFAPLFAGAQLSPEQVAAINKTLQYVKAAYNKLDARHRRMLDGYSNIVHFADAWQKYGMRLTDPSFIAPPKNVQSPTPPTPAASIVKVSNPSTHIPYSSMTRFTQSTTSTA